MIVDVAGWFDANRPIYGGAKGHLRVVIGSAAEYRDRPTFGMFVDPTRFEFIAAETGECMVVDRKRPGQAVTCESDQAAIFHCLTVLAREQDPRRC